METFPIDYPRVVEAFEFLQDWDARYQFITELGEKLPPYPDEERIDLYHVPECMSTVYIRAIRDNDGSFTFHGDCDTSTVKGVVAILLGMFNGKAASEIDEFDADAEQPCRWHFYKRPELVPAHYWTRLGKKKPATF